MPVQDARLTEVTVKGEIRVDVRDDVRGESAVDAVRWAATLLTQLGLDPHTSKGRRTAA